MTIIAYVIEGSFRMIELEMVLSSFATQVNVDSNEDNPLATDPLHFQVISIFKKEGFIEKKIL